MLVIMMRIFLVTILIAFGTASHDCIRPCPGNNIKCIRNYFVQHSSCKVLKGPIPNAVVRPDKFPVIFPRSNVTGIFEYLTYKGLDGKVIEFYVNPTTDNTVLTVEFTNFTLATDRLELLFHRIGKEPLHNADYIRSVYPKVAVTATIPNIYDLQLKDAFIVGFSYDTTPDYEMGSKFFTDPATKDLMKIFLSYSSKGSRHFMQPIAPFPFHIFVKYNICDFRVPLCVLLK